MNDDEVKAEIAKNIPMLEDFADNMNKLSTALNELKENYPLVSLINEGEKAGKWLLREPLGYKISHEEDREGVIYNDAIYERCLSDDELKKLGCDEVLFENNELENKQSITHARRTFKKVGQKGLGSNKMPLELELEKIEKLSSGSALQFKHDKVGSALASAQARQSNIKLIRSTARLLLDEGYPFRNLPKEIMRDQRFTDGLNGTEEPNLRHIQNTIKKLKPII